MKGAPPMVVMIGTAGKYLIFALVVLAIVGVGVFVAYRASNRSAD
jgi:hypothetical protein